MGTNATNIPNKPDRKIYNVPYIEGVTLGTQVSYDCKQYTVEHFFPTGAEAHASGLNHFMMTDRGCFGLKEI